MNKFYFAVFEEEENGFLVIFPDLQGCNTFGKTMEDAYEMSIDALAGWLEASETEFIKKPSTFSDIKKRYPDKEIIIPIPVVNL